ncbi:hypothetical protein ACFVWR_06845 [Leifsonia sp. NPDC058292]|uniref:hypothetical protein n=1 Tax=Leifsonia sp. NPDC058292 TaxID=3346428 RepID=UPI0036DBC38E
MRIREDGRHRHRHRRLLSAPVAAALIILGFTGCTSPTSSLLQAATDARSAVSSAQLAVSQQKSDRTFVTTTSTALGDAITELGSAEQSATEVAPSTPAETAAQKRTLREIRTATDAVLAAQRVVLTDAGSALPALRASTSDLTKLADDLQKAEAKK